jgi:hypothetical protein
MDTHFAPPAVPPGGGSIALTWYMIKGPLKGLVKVQVCRNQKQVTSSMPGSSVI